MFSKGIFFGVQDTIITTIEVSKTPNMGVKPVYLKDRGKYVMDQEVRRA